MKHNKIKNWLFLAVISLAVFLPVEGQADPLDNWTQRTSGTTNTLRDVAYGSGLFVAVRDGGTILTSTNGATWTPRTSGTTNGRNGVVFVKDGWRE